MSDRTTSRCARCGRSVETPYTPPMPGQVAVPADEFDRLLADVLRGFEALQERVNTLEVSLMIESALLEAVMDRG